MPTRRSSARGFINVEVAAAILLGLAAIATAFASFQSSLYGGKSVDSYSRANKIATEAAADRSRAIVEMAHDQSVDTQATRLILEADQATTADAEEDLRSFATYLYTSQMSAAGYKALGLPPAARESADDADADEYAALQEELLETAMEMDLASDENYRKEMLAKSQTLFAEADAVLKEAQDANGLGDKFQLAAVIYAISLFFGGIIQVFKQPMLQRAVLGAGALFFLGASGYLTTLPWMSA